ncbi:Membrane-bound lytic murein transglycosylase D [Olavius algarvensis associated proteobacterium Delta 3]|nr:Membrane-bound lytic murein transglycosylase D [Olavius algarvensis associated proteobacterium Delta 3]
MTPLDDNSVAALYESGDTVYSNSWPPQDPVTEDFPPGENPGKKVQSYIAEALDYIQIARDFWENGELENALEALDQAYSLVLKVETFDAPGLIQQKEDLRFTISKRILEIYASRNLVVNGTHDEIPVEINRHVKAEIKRFTKGGEKTFFKQSYQRSGRYRPYIVAKLKAAGLPEELSWLPLIESGYKVRALSKARALGLWQFIPSTGYKFGLKRDMYIDERLDPEKATRAAIKYLQELHKMFGDWTTVLAAYNSGEGRVLRVIRDQNINYLDNFWDLYKRLPLETARYVPRFLATLHIINNLEKYGLADIRLDEPLDFETVTVSRRMHLKNVAKALDVSEKELRAMNPELRYGVLPPENYEINVPRGFSTQLLAKLGEIPITTPPQRAFVYHRVRPGETLSTIAERYRTSVRSIQIANNIRRKNFIRAGQRLKIPQKGTRVYPAKAKSNRPQTYPSVHVVRSGESLWIIARRYGTTINAIQAENSLRSTSLHIGQELSIPGTKPPVTAKPTEGGRTYTVRNGDSPYTIALKHNLPLKKLLELNQLNPRSRIYPGQTLYIE